MGDAYVSQGGDLGSLSFNPAGLAAVKAPSLSFLHFSGVATQSTENLDYGQGFDFGTVGGSLVYRSQADIANPLATDPPVEAYDVALSLAYAVAPSHWLGDLPGPLASADAGVAVKYLRSHLGRYDADAFALDLGVRGPVGDGLMGGLSVLNLGPPVKFISVADPLPGTILVGVSREFEPFGDNKLNLSADAEAPFFSAFRGHLGVEDWLGKALAVRAGYIIDSNQTLGGLSGGFGLRLDQEGLLFQFDYAYRPFYYDGFNSLEGQHLFQMSLAF